MSPNVTYLLASLFFKALSQQATANMHLKIQPLCFFFFFVLFLDSYFCDAQNGCEREVRAAERAQNDCEAACLPACLPASVHTRFLCVLHQGATVALSGSHATEPAGPDAASHAVVSMVR